MSARRRSSGSVHRYAVSMRFAFTGVRASSRSRGADAECSALPAYPFSASVFPRRLKTARKTPSARGAEPGASALDRVAETQGSQRVAGATVADPLSHFPPITQAANGVRCHCFLRARQYATRAESRGHGAPVSDRHRAGARNPPRRRWPRSRGSAKPAPMTVRRTDLSDAPPARSGLRRSPRCAGRCRPEVGVPLPARRLCSIRTVPLAPLRGAVPTGGRRSLAGASLVLNRDCAVRPPAAGCADQRSAFPCRRVMVPVGVPAEMCRPAARAAPRK